jgi:hypothetical protein
MKKFIIALALLLPAPAMATVSICDGPGCAPTDSNVLVTAETGNPVHGATQGGTGVLFTSATDTLVGNANGQADVGAADGLLNSLKFTLTGGDTFGAATFNLFPLAGNQANETLSVILTWLLADGTSASGTFAIGTNGQNFEGIFGTVERFTSIEFLANPSTTGWGDLRQLRLGDVRHADGTPTPFDSGVPEPGTWLMMIIGFIGIGIGMRSKTNVISRRVTFG